VADAVLTVRRMYIVSRDYAVSSFELADVLVNFGGPVIVMIASNMMG
jgi:hypothetical protein